MSTRTKRFILPESEIPTQWYNIAADMPNKPMPPLNPQTREPLRASDLYPIFAKALADQEMNQTDAWIDIPEAVREQYKNYRCTPLVRAYELEKALGTPAHIYFKNESVSPVGSHKLNSAIAQAYFCKQEGITNITTETGAGQWGAALSYAAKAFGLELAVYMVKISYEQKPYRRSIMQTFGAQVTASPSMSTKAGRKILTDHPNYQGSLGTAISEAIELAMSTPNCKYTLGSVLSHVTLHQTIIGLEAEKQMAMAGEYPDIVIGCFGGGSNFGGISFPFMRHNILSGKKTRFIAAEPNSCPKLTRGVFRYDFGDEAGQDVALITGRCGDQQVCAVLKRLLLHVIAAAVAGQTAHVIDIDNVLDQVRVLVDDDNVVIFRRKLGGQGTANLAEADDHDSHTNAPFLFFKAGTHVGATIGRPRSLIAALRSPIVSCMASGQRASNARPY